MTQRGSNVTPSGRDGTDFPGLRLPVGCRRSIGRAIVALALLLGMPLSSSAQERWSPSKSARPEDVGSVDGIIKAFYEIVSGPRGQARDWGRDSTLYLPGVRFATINRAQSGAYSAGLIDHNTFAQQSNISLQGGFFEREINRVTQTFGPMVQVWSTYEWRTAETGPAGGRGINSLELFHDGRRWWIASAMWMGEDATHRIPPQYLPRG